MQLEATANQMPYQPTLFQRLGGKRFYAKVDNLWGYHQLRLTGDSSKVTAIIPWGLYRFLACPFGISTAPGEYQARMAHEILQDYYLNGAIYICKINYFLKKKNFYSNKAIPFYMPKSRSVDIDNIKEFKQAETFLKK